MHAAEIINEYRVVHQQCINVALITILISVILTTVIIMVCYFHKQKSKNNVEFYPLTLVPIFIATLIIAIYPIKQQKIIIQLKKYIESELDIKYIDERMFAIDELIKGEPIVLMYKEKIGRYSKLHLQYTEDQIYVYDGNGELRAIVR